MNGKIPEAIAVAAVGMLAPYCPGLTAGRLEAVLAGAGGDENVLSRAEAAKRLNVSTRTVDRMLREEELTRIDVRGSVRIREAELNAYLARSRAA